MWAARGIVRSVVAIVRTCKAGNVVSSSVFCLSDAALVGYLEGSDETRPVIMLSMDLSVSDPPFLDVRHHRLLPVDPVGEDDLSLELFTGHRV